MKQALSDVPVTDFSQPAPIKRPEENVLLDLAGAAGPSSISPQTQRTPAGTPTGDYDRSGVGAPPVTAPPISLAPGAVP